MSFRGESKQRRHILNIFLVYYIFLYNLVFIYFFIYFLVQASHLFINFASPLRSQEVRLYFVRQYMKYKDDKPMVQMFLLNHIERSKVSTSFLFKSLHGFS